MSVKGSRGAVKLLLLLLLPAGSKAVLVLGVPLVSGFVGDLGGVLERSR